MANTKRVNFTLTVLCWLLRCSMFSLKLPVMCKGSGVSRCWCASSANIISFDTGSFADLHQLIVVCLESHSLPFALQEMVTFRVYLHPMHANRWHMAVHVCPQPQLHCHFKFYIRECASWYGERGIVNGQGLCSCG